MLLLGQTRSTIGDEMDRLKLRDETVLQHVVRSDRVREAYLREAKGEFWQVALLAGHAPLTVRTKSPLRGAGT